MVLTVGINNFHKDCFKCSECKKDLLKNSKAPPIAAKCYTRFKCVYCSDCYHKHIKCCICTRAVRPSQKKTCGQRTFHQAGCLYKYCRENNIPLCAACTTPIVPEVRTYLIHACIHIYDHIHSENLTIRQNK